MAEQTMNARITGTDLGDKEHGIPNFWLHLEHEGGSQSFGGYALRGGFGIDAIMGVLKTLEVESWEALPGTILRIRGDGQKIEAIGHVLKDQWLNLAEMAAQHRT